MNPAPLLLLLAAAVSAAEIHVAPGGDDAGPGTAAQPYATLERARDAARTAPGSTVVLHGGLYPRTASLVLDAKDSGVTWRAAAGEQPRLSGGRPLPAAAWQPVSDPAILARLPEAARGHVLTADLKALGVSDLGAMRTWGFALPRRAPAPELWVNGQAATLARYPKTGWLTIHKVLDRGSIWGSIVGGQPELREKPDRGATFELDDPHLARWKTADDLWLFGYWWWDWADQAVKVESIDLDQHTLKTAQPHVYGFRAGARYYAYNLLEELDSPGEWYLDRTAGRVYLYPPGPIEHCQVDLSQLTAPLITLRGAKDVTLRGLTLECSRGAGLTANGCQNLQVRACTIRRLAAQAVSIDGGRDCLVSGCDICEVNNGISLSGGDRPSLTPGGHAAVNNHIWNYSRINRTYTMALNLQGVGLKAAHNKIHGAPHMAIGFGGNDHVIEFNEIYDVVSESADAGAIYTGRNWSMRGNVVRDNYLHDILGLNGKGAAGIYLDDCFSSADLIGNVLYRCLGLSFLIGGGRDNVIKNNVTIDSGPLHLDDRGLGWAKASTAPNGDMPASLKKMPYQNDLWRQRYPKLFGILDDNPGCPKGNVVQQNLFVRTPAPHIAKPAQEFGTISDNWVTPDDPGFVDAAGHDWRLNPDAAVFAHIPGFQAIALDQIGLVKDVDRPVLPPAAPRLSPASTAFARELTVTLAGAGPGLELRYTLDGSQPTPQSPRCDGPLTLRRTATLRAAAFTAGGQSSDVAQETYTGYALGAADPLPVSALPFVEAEGYVEPKRDENMAGGPLKLRGKVYERGLLLHPKELPGGGRAWVVVALGGTLSAAARFKATVGVEDTAQTRGSVVFIVEARRGGAWQKLFDSGLQRGGQPPVEIDLDISGADQLRLTTTDGGDGINSDHGAWGAARLE